MDGILTGIGFDKETNEFGIVLHTMENNISYKLSSDVARSLGKQLLSLANELEAVVTEKE
jgi:hypothetical protein